MEQNNRDNLEIYNKFKSVPKSALKEISAGKLNGMSSINPMWRIRCLTELFGPAGDGWWTENERFFTEPGANGEVIMFCTLNLICKKDIVLYRTFGIGGSKMVAIEKGKLVSNDEAAKMAYTDAISVACKSLGIGADVYWKDSDGDKYSKPISPDAAPINADDLPRYEQAPKFASTAQMRKILNIVGGDADAAKRVLSTIGAPDSRHVPIERLAELEKNARIEAANMAAENDALPWEQ